MNNLKAGLVAGCLATIVLSVMMIAKNMMGVMPGLDVIHMLSGMTGLPTAGGWIVHFMIGTIAWGGGFAILYDHIPGSSALVKGVVFGVGAWLAMMIAIMPMAGAGFFGMSLGITAPMMTLILHIIFGAVLGIAYQSRADVQTAH